MKNLIIIGAGGMGRQLCSFATKCIGYQTEFTIKGFIDDNLDSLDGHIGYPAVLDTIDNYKIEENDIFAISIGDVQAKKSCIEKILNKGGKFISLIHKTAIIYDNVTMGEGCIVESNAVIGVESKIGNFVLIQDCAIIGHDVTIGDWSRIDCGVTCVGGIVVGNEVCVHTGAVISHNVVLGDRCTVGAMSFVIKKVKPEVTVFGNPARILK